MHNEKVHFQKAEYLVKPVKEFFFKKLSVWLALIRVSLVQLFFLKGKFGSAFCKGA